MGVIKLYRNMSNVHLQNIECVWCIIFSIVVILNPVISENNIPQNECIGVNKGCVQKPSFDKSGSFSLEIKEGCDIYCVILDVQNNTSIINLTTFIDYLGQDVDLIKNSSDLKSPFNLKLYELTTHFDTNEEKTVLIKEWRENAEPLPCVQRYLSLSSKIFIEISGTGNWSHYKIDFSFDEIDYRLMKWTGEPRNGTQKIGYRPNSVSLLRLYKPKMIWSGIEIWFDDNLQISVEMGEYILIGTGTEPFNNKHSLPLCVTQVTENSRFFVDGSSAFVAFVSRSTQKETEDFKIMWKGIEEEIKDVIEDPLSVLNSSLICFYNYSAAKEEFEKGKKAGFETFRQMFKEISKEYLPREYETIDLNKLSVDLFGKPAKKTVNGLHVLSILIKVMYEQKSIFTWRQLQNIIEKIEENSTSILGYKVGKCPQPGQFDLLYKGEWSSIFYALVPVFGLFALMMWAWKQKLFAQNCLTEKEEKSTFDFTHAEPNTYETTPKVYRFDDEGRRETLIQGSSQEEDTEGGRDITMVEMNALPSTSQEQDTLSRFLKSQRSKSRPSLKSLLDNAEGINKQLSHSGKTEGNEIDHVYDSVSSSKQLNETKL